MAYRTSYYGPRQGRGFNGGRILVGLIIAGIAIFGYLGRRSENPITGETQHVAITQEQEVALGLQSAPEMLEQYGGASTDAEATAIVQAVGQKVVGGSDAARSEYPFHFVLLADPKTMNAFALPGGPVFITEALYKKLTSEGELAGVLGHEIGHVVARHGAEHLAQQELSQGLTGAFILSTYDPSDPRSAGSAQIALLVANLVNLKYGRNDELEADRLGVHLMSQAGYDPRGLLGVMKVLEGADEGGRPPEFLSTHPDPGNREGEITRAIAKEFPQGVPPNLTP